MWPFKKRFENGLAERARKMQLTTRVSEDDEGTMESISINDQGFYASNESDLGELAALIIAQAEADGVSRVKLHYGNNRMVYTIADTDYDMVPCPPPMNVDLVRAIAKVSGMTWNRPGLIKVAFADVTLSLNVSHPFDTEDPYLEISGFTGVARMAPVGA